MKGYHSLLARQLRRLLNGRPVPEEWTPLLDQVSDSYHQLDRDRSLLERSMELSSQEILQANEDIRSVLEGLIDCYIRLDGQGRILHSRGLTVPAIFPARTIINGKTILEQLGPESRPVVAEMLERMRMDRDMRIAETQHAENGSARHYEIRCIAAHNDQTSLIIRNITEAKMIARREKQLQQRLSRSERIESLGLLAGGVAHDLNNILSPLVSYPDLLIDSFPSGDPRRVMLQQMQSSVGRASAIIQDLLTLTRRGNNRLEPVDVNVVIRHYLASPEFEDLARRHPHVTVQSGLDDSLPPLAGSSHQLAQTIMNLMVNAFEAIGENRNGHVDIVTRLIAEPSAGETLEQRILEPHILLEVSDTGAGIPENELEHIFEPFFSRRKSGRSGTGLGLSIVYGTIKDFSGSIQVRSKIGEGTTFTIRLPLPDANRKDSSDPGAIEPEECKPCRILVVDDDAVQRELCQALLHAKGFTVSTVPGGREAVEYLRSHDVDLVLLDMIMEEDFDGLRTYETIRTFKPAQRCIIVSGYAKTDKVRTALSLGVHAFVQKPYTLKTLLEAIRSAREGAPV